MDKSVRINVVSILSGSCYLSQKTPFLNNTKVKTGNLINSIFVKLHISNLHKAIIPWLKSRETLKNCSFIYN